MRPHLESFSRAGRVAGPGSRPKAARCPSCKRTANTLRSKLLHTNAHRPLPLQTITIGLDQRRRITQNYARRTAEGKAQWAKWAEEIHAGKRQSFFQHLESRGLVHDVIGTREHIHRLFTNRRVGIYAGVDPTGPSLHVGHMLPFMILAWGYVWGLPVTWVLGGSTARVGDPTGRTESRAEVHSSTRKANIANMHMQLKKLGKSVETYGKKHGYEREWVWRRALANNNVWWNKQSVIEWLRDLGAYMRLGPMLGRETVKSRMNSGQGMSFAEFCYPLMQAWDWWVLFQKGVQVQVGGSDQYGNILFGTDAVKEISKHTAMQESKNDLGNPMDHPVGITTPLLTASNGEKIGKSGGNGVWLDKDMTTPFELYQYFVRTPDDQVERYLKLFTFLPLSKIDKIMELQNKDPSRRTAQHALASEFVELIHGGPDAKNVSEQHRQLFKSRPSADPAVPEPSVGATVVNPDREPPENYRTPAKEFANRAAGNKYAPQTNFSNVAGINVVLPESLVYKQTFNKVLWSAGMVNTRSEGARLITNGGAHVGARPDGPQKGEMPDDLRFSPIKMWHGEETEKFIIGGDLLLLRVGKWKFKAVKIISDQEFAKQGLTCPGWGEDPVKAGGEEGSKQE